MKCPRCKSEVVHENGRVRNTHHAAHFGLHQLKHSGWLSHPLGWVAFLGLGLGIVCKGVEMVAREHQCHHCHHKF